MDSRQDTRSRILEAAAELFSRKPFAKVSVDEVASRAGVSKGAVFHYFKSKIELAEACLKELLAKAVIAPVSRVARSSLSLEEKVRELVELAVKSTARYDARALSSLMDLYRELKPRGRGGFVKEVYRAGFRELSEMLRGVPKAELRARILMAALDGLAVQYMIAPEEFTKELVEELSRELARVIACR